MNIQLRPTDVVGENPDERMAWVSQLWWWRRLPGSLRDWQGLTKDGIKVSAVFADHEFIAFLYEAQARYKAHQTGTLSWPCGAPYCDLPSTQTCVWPKRQGIATDAVWLQVEGSMEIPPPPWSAPIILNLESSKEDILKEVAIAIDQERARLGTVPHGRRKINWAALEAADQAFFLEKDLTLPRTEKNWISSAFDLVDKHPVDFPNL